MSDSWNANQFQQGLPSQPGQVKLFDPTKFQTPAAFVGMEQPPKSQQQPQPAGGAQNPPTMQAAGSSWNSWGNWDWNADNTDPTVANQPQSGEQQNAISQHQPSQAGPGGGYQYYGDGDGQYSNAWNQGWDGAGQTYAQPDASGQYDQSQQHQYQYGGMAAQNQFGAYDPNSQQQDHQQQHQQPSQYFDGQHYDPQQQQQQQQQPQSDDQSQVYNQFPGHEQFPGQAQAFYDQPYDGGNTWTPTTEAEQWGTGFHPHQQQQNPETSGTENAAGQNQQSGNVQSTDGESIAPPNVNPQASQDNVLTAPSLAVYNHDDDGTVSGFFGRDDDGDVQLTSQKHGQSSFTSGDQGTGDVSSSNQFLGVDPSFHRTNSEISNASLSTLNMSNGDDEDGMEPLQNVQDLVQRMQEVDLSVGQGHSQETNVANLSDNNVPVAPNSSAVADQGQQHRGDYTGFGNTVSDHSAPPPNLPLDTNMRPSSPDINHPSSAESGGSGASGASSGLADWEIVPPQSEQLTHSRNSSLDNSASFFSDKPDGGVSLSAGDGNTVGQGVFPQGSQPPPFSSVSEESVHRNFENMDPSKHSSPRDSSSAASFQEPNPQHREQNRRSGSPFVAAVTDSSQEESAPKTHKTSPAKSLPGPNLSAPPPSQPTADGTANPFRREGGRSPRHASLPQPTKPDGTGSTAGLGSGDAKTAATPQQSADSQRKGMAALPSKPKVPSGSSTDDGSRLSRRDSDQSIKSTDSSSTRGKQGGEPQVRSSSRNSEEVALSSQQRRHHSAFHPVSRPRQTAMSPATTLWDNTETPTPNILLAPAMPLIIPGLNQYSASTTATSTTGAQGKGATQTAKSDNAGDRSSQRGQTTSNSDKTEQRDRKEDKNRSFDSLDELNPEAESPRDRSYRSQRSDPRESRQGRDPYRRDPDRPPSRYERPSSRNDRVPGQYQYERPSSRTDAYPRDRQRGYYRDYGDSYDERYDRPRSRQDESRGSRPSSRSGQEVDRPRSRNEYDRDRDYYYKDRHRGYAYDSYGKHLDYYNDERERYYRYYKDREARYTRGYYEEYYGTKHAEYYQQYQQQLQQQQQQQQQQQSGRHSRPDYERSSSRSQSRGNTPGPVTSRGNTPAHVSSRGNTPGVPPSPGVAPSPGPDYYNNRGSRPSSRTDYARDYYGRGYAYDGYQAYYDGYGYDPYAYGYGYPGYEDYSQAQDQGRLTPPKYSYPHVRASFGPNGQLVKVLPNRPADGQPAIVEVQDVQSVLESCPEAEELKQFPGPLTRTNTHKKDVLLFCQLKARACAEDINMTDRESAQLIWKFLELLIKQNGSVVGTDLSDLLLEGHEPSTHEYSLHGMRISNSSDALDTVPEGNSEDTGSARGSPAVRVTSDRTVISSADREREKWIDRFRHLLLYGRKKDALECAMKNNLWGHALFLASKMDTRTHANVMTRFANSAMRMNDPLQTLYQLMSGRQPAAVTCVGDERWGDWRPHLAMVLSNSTSRHDLDRKSISTLGDTLASKGYLHASHFCYLMAQVNFGSYNKKTSKIVLIGSSHNQLSMEEFATNEAIQCTEVYEYAQVLGNAAFCLPYFQMYKYLYACRLADYGMASEALHYCEVIATNVQQYPTWFQPSFVKLVFQLSSKMKFSDPQRQLTSEDAEDPVWLQQLEKVCTAYGDGTIQPVSGTATPAGFPGTTTSSESGDYNPYAYGYSGDTSAMSGTGVDAYGNVQHQQQAQYGTDYYSNQDPNAVTAQPQAQNVTGTTDPQYQQQQGYDQQQQGYDQQQQLQQQQYDYNQWQQQYGYQYAGYGDHYTQPPQQQQQSHDEQHHAAGEDSTEHQQYSQHTTPQHQHQQQQHEGEADGSHQQYQYDGSLTYSNNAAVTPRDVGHDDGARGSAAAVADDKASLGGAPLDASSASSQLSAQLHSQGYDQYGTTTGQQHQQFPPRASISTNETEDEDNVNDDDDDDDEDVTDAPTSGFDYFGNVGQQKVVAPPHRFRSMSGSSTGSTRRRRTTSGSSTGSVKAAPHKPAPPPGGPLGSKPGDKKAAPPGKGWFSGLFGKLGAKGKNEMILPDDKNPAIVWDPVKNKWTNADGEEQDEAPAAPPPKDTDLMGKPSAAPPSASMPPPPSVPAGGNRFSLKNKGARNQYVDVNNPKPVAVPQDLFNVMPGTTAPSADGSATTAAPQLFLPGGVSSGDTSANNSTSNTNTNNSSLAVPGTDDRLSRSSSVSSFSQEVQQYMAEPAADTSVTQAPAAAVQSQQPAAMPMLFNPASLKTNKAGAGHASSAAGPGLKYGQRRAYPK